MADEKAAVVHDDVLEAKTDLTLAGEVTWTEEEETRVRRKLDWQIVPMVTGKFCWPRACLDFTC